MNKTGVNDLPAPIRKQIEVIYIYLYTLGFDAKQSYMLVDHS